MEQARPVSVCIGGGSGPLRGLLAPCVCDLSKEGVPLYSQLASAECPECAGAIGPAAQPLPPFPPPQHFTCNIRTGIGQTGLPQMPTVFIAGCLGTREGRK